MLLAVSRRRGGRCRLCALVAALVAASRSTAAAPPASVLPLERVRMYDSGVAYFERAGIPHAGELTLPVPSAHLDDALKTIVVLSDEPRATVERVEFASAVSRDLGEALSGLSDDADSEQLLSQLTGSLRGAEVEARARGTVERGRVLGIDVLPDTKRQDGPEETAQKTDSPPKERRALLLLSSDGSLRKLPLDEVSSIRVLDSRRAHRLHEALDAISTSSKPRMLRLIASGKQIRLGYIAQAPVWRATYRLVLSTTNASPFIGWALVHNDTDEDWIGVRLELVNGRPSSFLLPMAAPRYAERDMMPLDEDLQTVPQLLDVTVDGMQEQEGSGHGHGIGLGAVGYGTHHAASPAMGPTASSRIVLGDLANSPLAGGAEAGSLFLYTPSSPLTLGARRSAMVPFVNATVSAKQVAWLAAPDTAAQRAIVLANDTKQTLPPGSLAVFADGGFAGEGTLDRLKPAERRLIPFGADLDVEVHQRAREVTDRPRIVEARVNALVEHYIHKRIIRYEIANKSGSSRSVVLELDAVSNARVTGANQVGFDDVRKKPYATFDVGATQRVERTLIVEEGLEVSRLRSKLTAAQLRTLAATITAPALRDKLLRAAKELANTEAIRRSLGRADAAMLRVTEDLVSLRASMQVLYGKGGAEEIAARIVRAEGLASRLRRKHAILHDRAISAEGRAWQILQRPP